MTGHSQSAESCPQPDTAVGAEGEGAGADGAGCGGVAAAGLDAGDSEGGGVADVGGGSLLDCSPA